MWKFGSNNQVIFNNQFMQARTISEEQILEMLAASYINKPINEFPDSHFKEEPRPAAVLLPLVKRNLEWHLLYIRRTSSKFDRHSGQVAFPGGAVELADANLENTALREAHEEVGINPKDVRILGRLRSLITISNFHLSPIVGVLPWPYSITPSPNEVEHTFTIPLNWLANSSNHVLKTREIPGSDEKIEIVYFNKFKGELLWGVSARITLGFLNALQVME